MTFTRSLALGRLFSVTLGLLRLLLWVLVLGAVEMGPPVGAELEVISL